jgi:uncharacterized NAD(P)/FAD-binding protein YdhS
VSDRPVVAIVGAGFSGSLLALHLLDAGPPDLRILLIERAARFGRGLAYAADNPRHLLNVRVANMSAWPDRPRHLEQWLARRGVGEADGPADFITRGVYGQYIASMLRAALARPDGAHRLVLVQDEATRLDRRGRRLGLTFAMGRRLEVDALVLAIGNPPPASLPGLGLEALPARLYAPDPWAAGALDDLDETARVILLGTGLTMVDVALSLEARGAGRSILAISRRGLAPRRHAGAMQVACDAAAAPTTSLSQLLRHVRARARVVGWRQAVDELRPVTQALWRGASLDQRRRFLRHLRPWWDVHRHRMAPAVADRMEAMRKDGRLTVAAGQVLAVEAAGEAALVTWRRRGEAGRRAAPADRIINCTGPGGDPARSDERLLADLIRSGAARADVLGLGLDVDGEGRLIGAAGEVDRRLHAVGPSTRGACWEIIAVPDIRNQVADLARRLGRQLAEAPRP